MLELIIRGLSNATTTSSEANKEKIETGNKVGFLSMLSYKLS